MQGGQCPRESRAAEAENGTNYRGLALDLDGTLLDEASQLRPAVIAEVRRLVRAGVTVCLATGRMTPAAEPFWRQLALTTPLAAYNGARIVIPGQAPLFARELPANLAQAVLELGDRHGWHFNIYARDQLFVRQRNGLSDWYTEMFKVGVELLPDETWPLTEATKLLVIAPQETDLEPIKAGLARLCGDRAQLTTSSRRFVEVLPAGVNKGTALTWLAEWSGVPVGQWVAAGDGLNDLEVLQTAGLGVTVTDGEPELRKIARLILPPLAKTGMAELAKLFGSR